jgi:hypothetical protein
MLSLLLNLKKGVVKPAEDCKLLQFDVHVESVQKWCIENNMKINIFKTNIIYFHRKTNSIQFT